jgi:hypothetical protein
MDPPQNVIDPEHCMFLRLDLSQILRLVSFFSLIILINYKAYSSVLQQLSTVHDYSTT